MLVVALSLVLQQSRMVDANAADTAFVRRVIGLAAHEVTTVPRNFVNPVDRLTRQMTLWGMADSAWTTALAGDRRAPRGYANDTGYLSSAQYLGDLWQRDSVTARQRLATVPAAERDDVLQALAQRLAWTNTEVALSLSRLIESPRRRVLAQQSLAQALRPKDSVRARELYSEMIVSIRHDSSPELQRQSLFFLIEFRRLGGQVTPAELVAAARVVGAKYPEAALVQQLNASERAELRPMIDSVISVASRDTARYASYARVALLKSRGTAADSVRANMITDSVRAGLPSPPGRYNEWESTNAMNDAVRSRDTAKVNRLLATTPENLSRILLFVSNYLAFGVPRGYYGESQHDSTQLHFFAQLHQSFWRAANRLSPVMRDSVRVNMTGLRADFDTQGALRDARSIRNARFQQRAVAYVAKALSESDVDAAEALAQPLIDSIAETIAFGALTQRAVQGGRLTVAGHWADRVRGREGRIRAQTTVVQAELKLDPDRARMRAQRELKNVDPRWRCEGACAYEVDGPPPETFGMPPKLTGDFLLVALQTGLRQDLIDWAIKLPTAEKRVAGLVAITEQMSAYKLHEFVGYPIN